MFGHDETIGLVGDPYGEPYHPHTAVDYLNLGALDKTLEHLVRPLDPFTRGVALTFARRLIMVINSLLGEYNSCLLYISMLDSQQRTDIVFVRRRNVTRAVAL